MWAGYKVVHWRSKGARMKSLHEVDLHTGRKKVSQEEWEKLVEYENWSFWKRFGGDLRF